MGSARSVVALLAAIAVVTLYAAPPGCQGPVHVASCCKSHCPGHHAPSETAPCCGVPRDPGYPATATGGLQAPVTAFVHALPGLAASISRPPMVRVARASERIKIPIFLELLTLRR
jgi:hypothetical protein